MAFRDIGDGAVEGVFACDRRWEGAEERLHGGVVAALLDGAMYTCLAAL
jgi:acyl-coenzyme A thioesterase PaaI-like protein